MTDGSAGKEHFPHITAPLRHLTIASASVLLSRFDRMLRKIHRNTLVEDLTMFRQQGISAHHLIFLTRRAGEPSPTTGLTKLQSLCFGSPTLRYILHQLRTYVLPTDFNAPPKKLLITEDVPLNAWFWEVACNFVYVEAEVLHAGLTDHERVALVRRFNDSTDSLTVLIIMYQVSAQGVNLDACCARAVVATPAINAPSEIQGWSRIIRVSLFFSNQSEKLINNAQVSQKQPVLIIRTIVLNSHDQYRDSKQTDKAVIDLATRSFSTEVKNLLVDLLQESNEEVRMAHESHRGQVLLAKESQAVLEQTNVSSDQNSSTPSPAKRKRKAPERVSDKILSDPKYQRYGRSHKKLKVSKPKSTESAVGESEYEDVDDQSLTSDDEEFESYSNDEDEEEEAKGVFFESLTTKKLREQYSKLDILEQENYSQEDMNIRRLLQLSPTKIYTVEDLQDPEILDRGLRLLFNARFGQTQQMLKISPHIEYDQLPKALAASIKKRMMVEEDQIQKVLTFLQSKPRFVFPLFS